jgi:hypothetical protein
MRYAASTSSRCASVGRKNRLWSTTSAAGASTGAPWHTLALQRISSTGATSRAKRCRGEGSHAAHASAATSAALAFVTRPSSAGRLIRHLLSPARVRERHERPRP